jgi:uncharacterized membrane protein YcaP (DUF421 family)
MLYLEIAGRVILTFGVLLLLTRLSGKKQLSQVTFFDFITAIAIGDIAAEKLSDPETPLLPWLMGTLLWFGMTIALDLLVLHSRKAGKLIEGEPAVIVENGRIYEKRLKRNFLRVDDLLALLRGKGCFNLQDVEFAVFETDGTVSVLPKSQVRPVTPRDLKVATPYEGLARELVFQGRMNEINLQDLGLDEAWLRARLAEQGYQTSQVFFAAIDTQGQIYVDGYNDPIAGSPVDVRDYGGPH